MGASGNCQSPLKLKNRIQNVYIVTGEGRKQVVTVYSPDQIRKSERLLQFIPPVRRRTNKGISTNAVRRIRTPKLATGIVNV